MVKDVSLTEHPWPNELPENWGSTDHCGVEMELKPEDPMPEYESLTTTPGYRSPTGNNDPKKYPSTLLRTRLSSFSG